jgi:hypothetical protein
MTRHTPRRVTFRLLAPRDIRRPQPGDEARAAPRFKQAYNAGDMRACSNLGVSVTARVMWRSRISSRYSWQEGCLGVSPGTSYRTRYLYPRDTD